MAELLGSNYVYSMKPSPTPLSFSTLDKDKIRADLRNNLRATRDCRVEVIMKDNHTLGNNPMNAVHWCRIAKEEINRL